MGPKTKLGIKIFFAGVFTMLLTTFIFTSNMSLGEKEKTETPVAAGELLGTAEGHNGPVTVAVTMDGDTIKDVKVTEHEESPGYSDKALVEIPAAIVAANSTEVEAISGASVTSKAIMEAASNAIAGGSGASATDGNTVTAEAEGHNGLVVVEVTFDGDKITAVDVVEHEESPGYSDKPLKEIPAAIVAANSTDVEVISGASVTSKAIIDAVNTAIDGRGGATPAESKEETKSSSESSEESAPEEVAKDNANVVVNGDVVTSTVEGRNGPVVVDVTFDGDKIKAVEVVEHEESPGYSDRPLKEIPAAMVKDNTADVEVISGATITSQAIIDAVKNAVTAKGGDAAEAATSETATDDVVVDGDKVKVTVEGHNGPVVVEVTFDGDTIKAVDVVEHEESKGYSDKALKEIPAAIVKENKADVEVISGASVTSQAIIDAVAKAIEARK